MDNMTEKLIKDGSEVRKAKFNLIMISIGTGLLLLGIVLILLKGVTVEYIDAEGILHENFFLIPMGILSIFSSIIIFFVVSIRTISARKKR